MTYTEDLYTAIRLCIRMECSKLLRDNFIDAFENMLEGDEEKWEIGTDDGTIFIVMRKTLNSVE